MTAAIHYVNPLEMLRAELRELRYERLLLLAEQIEAEDTGNTAAYAECDRKLEVIDRRLRMIDAVRGE